jgi:hypothetical protein
LLGHPHFRSVREAADWARGTLGIPIVNYTDASLEMATIANEALGLVHGHGWKLPRAVFIAQEAFGGRADDLARLEPNYGGRLEVNPHHDYWHGTWAELQARTRYYGSSRWWSSADVRHPIVHELGHLAHWDTRPETWGADWGTGAIATEQRALARAVSRYAAPAPGEFVAEVFAGLLLGQAYSAQILALYRLYGGLEP